MSEFTKQCRNDYVLDCFCDKKCGQDFDKAIELLEKTEQQRDDLLVALVQIAGLETECCPRCEGDGRLWADGKVHFQSEQRDTILCGNCGGSGRLLPEDAQIIAEAAILKATQCHNSPYIKSTTG